MTGVNVNGTITTLLLQGLDEMTVIEIMTETAMKHRDTTRDMEVARRIETETIDIVQIDVLLHLLLEIPRNLRLEANHLILPLQLVLLLSLSLITC
jgi:hypothetical protein